MSLKKFFRRKKVPANNPDPNCEDKFEVLVGKKEYCRHQEAALEANARAAVANDFVEWLSDLKGYVDTRIKPVMTMAETIEAFVEKKLADAAGLVNYSELRIEQERAREDTIIRAENLWGLDYAGNSEGLYPTGNQIGRAPFRPGMTRGEAASAMVMSEGTGGEWRISVAAKGSGALSKDEPMALGTDKNGNVGLQSPPFQDEMSGWGNDSWLDFYMDEDMYLIHHGFQNLEPVPTITEFTFILSGNTIPPQSLRWIYNDLEKQHETWLNVPNVISPKSQIIYKLRSSRVNLQGGDGGHKLNPVSPHFDPSVCIAERFGILGEVIAKRSYLIRQTY